MCFEVVVHVPSEQDDSYLVANTVQLSIQLETESFGAYSGT